MEILESSCAVERLAHDLAHRRRRDDAERQRNRIRFEVPQTRPLCNATAKTS
jgi:hypothetical protein